MVSHRSGETTDAFIVDLAVATGRGQLKSSVPAAVNGSPTTTALVEIDDDTGLPYGQLTIGLPGPPSIPEIFHPETVEALYRMEPTAREERA